MSLNSVVNNLVRAAAGIPADISDKDLDQHVATLLAKEAKEREMKWSEIGLGGLLGSSSTERGTPDPNAPKPNKRFLASVIRTVDTHNSSVIRQQLEAAEAARSNSGLGESSRSAASRMFGGAMRDAGRSSTNKGKHRDDRDRYDSRGRRDDRRGRDRDRDRSAERWNDKRQASRERRTRYDPDEEEEMYNAGEDRMAERKVKRDWTKRKEERDKRRKAREEAGEDEESERRRKDLYGDENDAPRGSNHRRQEAEDMDDERSPKKSRREESDHEDGENTRRRRRRRDSRSPEKDDAKSSTRDRRERREKPDDGPRRRSRSPRPDTQPKYEDDSRSSRHRSPSRSPRKSKSSRDDHEPHPSSKPSKTKDSSPSKSSRSKRHSPSPPSSSRRSKRVISSPSLGPSAPPPPDLAPPPPDSPPPPPPPAPASKMDKYFESDYDPRLDLGEVASTGYVPEVGWDNMLAILKERGKKPRNRSPGLYDDPLEIPKVRLRRTPSPTLKEIEKAERRAKRAARGFDDDFETEAERSKRKAERKKEKEERARVTQLGPGDGGGLFDVAYVKKGGVREWDVGK